VSAALHISLDALLEEELAAENASKTKRLHEDEQIELPEADKNDPFFREAHDEKPDFYLEDQTEEDADSNDPDLQDWYQPAKLLREFADSNLGAKHLNLIADSESEDAIAKAIHSAIYLNEKQLENKHDRIMMDVPRDGHRKGGTHAIAPEKRRVRYAKIVNESLTCRALVQIPGEEDVHESDRLERSEAETWRIAGNAKLRRELAYCLSVYQGKYLHILALMAELKTVPEIAKLVGKSDRRIRQIVHGNASKGRKAKPGLRQICREIVANGVPSSFQSNPPVLVEQPVPVLVQPVHTLKKSFQKEAILGQLAWDFDALSVGVAA